MYNIFLDDHQRCEIRFIALCVRVGVPRQYEPKPKSTEGMTMQQRNGR